jgi:hypothetical protein
LYRGRRNLTLSASGYADVDGLLGGLIGQLRAKPEVLAQALRDCAAEIDRLLAGTIAAGTDAYGEPWTLTQDGRVPLRDAADAVSVTLVGSAIRVDLSGVEVLHHVGAARGYGGGTIMRRPIIPEKAGAGGRARGLPASWERAITRVMTEALRVG